jgi:two-component system response regulator YesN
MPLCHSGVFRFQKTAGYGVLNYDSEKHDEIRRSLRLFLNQLETQKYIVGGVELTLAAGKAAARPEKLPESMRAAQEAVAERIVEGTGRLYESVMTASGIDSKKLLDKYGKYIDRAIDTLNAEAADEALSELTGETAQAHGIRGYELLDMALSAGRIFVMRLYMKDEPEAIQSFEERCGLCGSADKLVGCLRDFQRQQINAVREQRENEAIRPIRIAKQYIYNHSHEPITLEDVCAATGFSSSYFSTIFKKETGEGFAKYLTRVRIERAKDLLQNTSLPIAEICIQIGYSDIKHFTSTFKKITDLNPGQYRKLFG